VSTPLFDLSYLHQVFQGNDRMVDLILGLFRGQIPGYLEQMELRYANGDWRSIHPLAHKAKSGLSMLGMGNLHGIVLDLETRSRHGASDAGIEELLIAARALLDASLAELDKQL
jgi:HPt (histidine-containing phosphotransfer) domain-containing protein